jgi:hypothetical protein
MGTIDTLPVEDRPMRYCTLSLVVALSVSSGALAYVEAPYSLGQVCHESTNVIR